MADISARLLPHASYTIPGYPVSCRLRLGVSIGQRLARPGGSDTPLRVLAPQHPWHWAFLRRSGLCVHLAGRRPLPSESPPALWTVASLPELSGLLIGANQAPLISSKCNIPRFGESSKEKFSPETIHSRPRKLARATVFVTFDDSTNSSCLQAHKFLHDFLKKSKLHRPFREAIAMYFAACPENLTASDSFCTFGQLAV